MNQTGREHNPHLGPYTGHGTDGYNTYHSRQLFIYNTVCYMGIQYDTYSLQYSLVQLDKIYRYFRHKCIYCLMVIQLEIKY